MWGSQEKKFGQKVNDNFSGFLSQIFFGSHFTCGEVRKKIWGKKSMKNFSG